MKKIIINADDFGLTDGCNRGIIKAIKKGLVTSTTIMMNMAYANKGIDILKSMNFKSLGIHLTLTCGEPSLPVSEVPTLVNSENKFYKRKESLFPHMKLEEVEKELKNQIELFLKTGLKPSHLDSHHHIHMCDGIREITVKLAKYYNLPLRYVNKETKNCLEENNIKTTDKFSMDFYGENATIETIRKTLSQLKSGSMELMVHPGLVDDELMKLSSYNIKRSRELEILTNDEVKLWIKENGYTLIGYDQLK